MNPKYCKIKLVCAKDVKNNQKPLNDMLEKQNRDWLTQLYPKFAEDYFSPM